MTPTSSTKLGGASSHTYQYDKLNRLISATGSAKDASYTLNMAYNVMSMPLSKEQTTDGSKTAQSYHNYYKYEDSDHPSAPSEIGHEHYTYDANGNPTRVENDSTAAVREMYWDEDNRLMVLSDNGKTSRYTYNHAGERAVKSHGSMEGVYINGAPQGITFHETDEYTLYPASIISVNKNRYTKHYFIGDKRIASRIGSGSFNNVYGQNGSFLTAGQQDYAERMSQIENQREDYYRELGIAPGIPTMKGSYGDPENTGVGYNTIIKELGDHTVPAEWAQYVKHNTEADTAPGAPIQWDDPSDPETALPGYGFVADNSGEPEETFYYHSDHLGSTSYITDGNGNITQYDAYLPYGELLVDEHSSSEEMPYKFNGKELDEETGLYYYGARYMQPIASIWYGVDPLTEKYPSVGGYTYCLGNPIRLVDPDGMEQIIPPIGPSINIQIAIVKAMGHHNVKTAAFVIGHPKIASSIGSPNDKGTISNTASNFEINIAKGIKLKYGNPGDNGNAIRHTAWQAMITKEFGEDIAKKVADCHEDDWNKVNQNVIFSNREAGDTYVDLKNNEIGRSIGKSNPNATNKQILVKVMEHYESEGLYVLKQVAKNKWVPVLDKISEQQLKQAIQIIESKNENGLNK